VTQIPGDSPKLACPETSSSKDERSLAGFEELALPLLDAVYNLARWLVKNQSDAEDLVQETYVKGLRGFSSFRRGTNFRAWMFRILRNTFLTARTGLTAGSMVPLDSEADGPELAIENETPETILIERSSAQQVVSAIDDLPLHYRETLLLCDLEEMSYREAADILSIPIGTVMSRLSRARKVLRESLLSSSVHHHRETHLNASGALVGRLPIS
jgi:RNA polymerase sigma-70 factor (ECF subfamily)